MQDQASFLALVEYARQFVTEVTPAEVARQLKSAEAPPRLVDVRETHEWQSGCLPEAIGISRGMLEQDLERQIPDKSTPIIFYCSGGFRSILAAESAQKKGYTHVASMTGGSRLWIEQGLPIE